MFIYIDESGDLGFDFGKKGTSKYFIITALAIHTPEVQRGFIHAVKKTLRNKVNRNASRNNPARELKGSKTSQKVKEYFYRHVPSSGWGIYSVTLNKERVNEPLRTKTGKKKLYNFLAHFLLSKIKFDDAPSGVNLVMDRCKNTEEIKDFNRYIVNQLEALLPLQTNLYPSHEDSSGNACLQAADMFCWGIARKHHFGEVEWYGLYRQNIRYDEMYLPAKKE